MTASLLPVDAHGTENISHKRRWLQWAGMIAAIVLLLAAVFTVASQRDVLDRAMTALSKPSPMLLAGLFGGVLANIILTGLLFSLLLRRFGKVGLLEMQAVVSVTTLVNYLPLRPGLFGRIAYHKAANHIAVRHTTQVILENLAIGVAVISYLSTALVLCYSLDFSVSLAAIGPIPLLAIAALIRPLRLWSLAGLLRLIDVIAWAGRYWCAFGLLGSPVTFDTALALACVSCIATSVPFISNGLGLREWAVGLLSPLLAGYDKAMGLTAELIINRAAELIMVLLAGSVGAVYLLWLRRGRNDSNHRNTTEPQSSQSYTEMENSV